MAPKSPKPDDKGKVRIRFIEVELEGSNETLLEGIRSITAAMPASQTTVVNRAALPSQRTSRDRGLGLAHAEIEEDSGSDDEQEFAAVESEGATDEVAGPAPARRARSPRSAPKPPALSTNLRLDAEPMPLTEFIASLNVEPSSPDMDKAIAVAVWLKEHRQINEMSAADFYTCCKFMDWAPPTDLTSPMRNLKRDQKLDSAERGKFAITLLGEKHLRGLRR